MEKIKSITLLPTRYLATISFHLHFILELAITWKHQENETMRSKLLLAFVFSFPPTQMKIPGTNAVPTGSEEEQCQVAG